MWIDAHCHLAHPEFTSGLEAVLQRSRESGVSAWIQGGISPDDWGRQVLLSGKHKGIIKAFGLHPWWVATHSDEEIDQALDSLESLLFQADAIGELGVDLSPKYESEESKMKQIHVFEKQLAIASADPKPLILHIVRAHSDALKVLRKRKPYPARGIVHSFSASYDTAKQYLDMGFLISLGGSVTWEGFHELKKAIPRLPAEAIVIETDSPDQTPALEGLPRSGRNEPRHLLGIARQVGALRGESGDEVLNRSTENLKKVFREIPQ